MEELDPDKLKGPGGLTLRQIHEQVKASTTREDAGRTRANSSPAAVWWRRFMRSILDKKPKS
jgi:hypothetical protein